MPQCWTAMSNVGNGVESAGVLGRPPPRPISTEYVACAGLFSPPSGINHSTRGWYSSNGTRIHLVTKSGWTEDEMVLVAREEDRLVEKGRHLCGNESANITVNQDLFPNRSADAIRGLRKSVKYHAMRDRLPLGGSPAEDQLD